MNVRELIEKLAQMPPSAEVVTDDNQYGGYEEIYVYAFRGNVERRDGWTDVRRDNGRDSVEKVVLISAFGQDEMEEL